MTARVVDSSQKTSRSLEHTRVEARRVPRCLSCLLDEHGCKCMDVENEKVVYSLDEVGTWQVVQYNNVGGTLASFCLV